MNNRMNKISLIGKSEKLSAMVIPGGMNGYDSKYSRRGMTLIEIIIVVALLGTLMTYLVTNIVDVGESAKIDQAKIAMQQIKQNLDIYKIHVKKYPTAEQGLRALIDNPGAKNWRGPYTDDQHLKDPWDGEFSYELAGGKPKIISAGPDGAVGTEDDVVYPDDADSSPSE